MFINSKDCRKARVIRETIQPNGLLKREALIEKGIAVKITSIGAYVFDTEDPAQKDRPIFAEWFPFSCKEGIRTILYC